MIRVSVHYAFFGPMIQCFLGQLHTQPTQRERERKNDEIYFTVTHLTIQHNWSLCGKITVSHVQQLIELISMKQRGK